MSKLDNIFFLFFYVFFIKRQLQDLNLRANFTTDFKSVSLTARTSCLYIYFLYFLEKYSKKLIYIFKKSIFCSTFLKKWI